MDWLIRSTATGVRSEVTNLVGQTCGESWRVNVVRKLHAVGRKEEAGNSEVAEEYNTNQGERRRCGLGEKGMLSCLSRRVVRNKARRRPGRLGSRLPPDPSPAELASLDARSPRQKSRLWAYACVRAENSVGLQPPWFTSKVGGKLSLHPLQLAGVPTEVRMEAPCDPAMLSRGLEIILD